MEKVLSGFRVVNTGCNLPAPLAAKRLQEMGATVVKVEPPGGDPFENYSPTWYQDLHCGQQVVHLDLKSESGRSTLHNLLEAGDLLITSNRPSALKRLGLAWENVHARYPKLCQVAILGYAPPNEEIPGHDLTYQAQAGLLSPPALPRILLADLMGAERAIQASLGLLLARSRSGEGGFAQVALTDGVESLSKTLRYGLTASGNLLGEGDARYNLYQTKSGWIALAALEDHLWQALIRALGLASPPDKAVLMEIFISKTSDEWENWAQVLGIPLCRVIA